jgi:hypothetical protein
MTKADNSLKTLIWSVPSQAILWPYQLSFQMLQASLQWQKSLWALADNTGTRSYKLPIPDLGAHLSTLNKAPTPVWPNPALPQVVEVEPENTQVNVIKPEVGLEAFIDSNPSQTPEPRPLAKSLAISPVAPEPLKSPRSRNRGRR